MLLVLFVAGRTDPAIIARHRRLDGYSVQDYVVLQGLLADAGGVVYVTPHTLAEASNLLGQHGEPERSALMQKLAELICTGREITVRSAEAARNLGALGLTDAALLETVSEDRPPLTADFELFLAAVTANARAAINFHHLRAS